jgi:hypothetical protein
MPDDIGRVEDTRLSDALSERYLAYFPPSCPARCRMCATGSNPCIAG